MARDEREWRVDRLGKMPSPPSARRHPVAETRPVRMPPEWARCELTGDGRHRRPMTLTGGRQFRREQLHGVPQRLGNHHRDEHSRRYLRRHVVEHGVLARLQRVRLGDLRKCSALRTEKEDHLLLRQSVQPRPSRGIRHRAGECDPVEIEVAPHRCQLVRPDGGDAHAGPRLRIARGAHLHRSGCRSRQSDRAEVARFSTLQWRGRKPRRYKSSGVQRHLLASGGHGRTQTGCLHGHGNRQRKARGLAGGVRNKDAKVRKFVPEAIIAKNDPIGSRGEICPCCWWTSRFPTG